MTKKWSEFYGKDIVENMQAYINREKCWDLTPCLRSEGSVDYSGMFNGIKFPDGFKFDCIDISNADGSFVLFENCTFETSNCLYLKIKVYNYNKNKDMPENRHVTLFKNCDMRDCWSIRISVVACSGMRLFDDVKLPTSGSAGVNEIDLSYRSSDMRLKRRDCRNLVKNTNFYNKWAFDLLEFAISIDFCSAVQCENMFENCRFGSGFQLSGSVGNRKSFINVARMFNNCDFGLNTSIDSNLFGGGKMLCIGSYPFLYKCTLERTPIKSCSGLSLDSVANTTELNEKVFEWLSSNDKKVIAVCNLMDSGVPMKDVFKNLKDVEAYSRRTKDTHLENIKIISELAKRILMAKENGRAKYTVGEAVDSIVQIGFSREDVALGVIEFIKDDYLEE